MVEEFGRLKKETTGDVSNFSASENQDFGFANYLTCIVKDVTCLGRCTHCFLDGSLSPIHGGSCLHASLSVRFPNVAGFKVMHLERKLN